MVYGRGEKEIGDALRERGLEVVPQVRVYHEQNYGHYYDIDLGLFPLAVEVHGDKNHPRHRQNFQDRSSWLVRQGWAIAYVWLYKDHNHTEKVIDELESFYRELLVGNADRYRLYHWDGQLMEKGGLGIEYYVDIDTGPWRNRDGAPEPRRRGRVRHGFFLDPGAAVPEELQDRPSWLPDVEVSDEKRPSAGEVARSLWRKESAGEVAARDTRPLRPMRRRPDVEGLPLRGVRPPEPVQKPDVDDEDAPLRPIEGFE